MPYQMLRSNVAGRVPSLAYGQMGFNSVDGIFFVGMISGAPLQIPLSLASILSNAALTGTPTAPDPAANDNSARVPNTRWINALLAAFATLASPTFTGTPQAPNPPPGDATKTLSTTLFVSNAAAGAVTASRGKATDLNAVTDLGIDNTGGTNVAAALQAAMAQAVQQGRELVLPAGTYLIDVAGSKVAFLKPPTGLRMRGAGWTRTVLKRTLNTEVGTVECNNVTDVIIRDIGIVYAPTQQFSSTAGPLFTGYNRLGYAQSGFCARNGSSVIKWERCGVTGPLNRNFHILNSTDVDVTECYSLGGADAALRVVSDKQAGGAGSIYSDNPNGGYQVPDEASSNFPALGVCRINIRRCFFSAYTTLNGTGTAAFASTFNGTNGSYVQFYGVNFATVNSGSDTISDCVVEGTTVSGVTVQGISVGGNCDSVRIDKCSARSIGSPSVNGVGYLVQSIGSMQPNRTSITNSTAFYGQTGVWLTGAINTKVDGVSVSGFFTSFLITGPSSYPSTRTRLANCMSDNLIAYNNYQPANYSFDYASFSTMVGCSSIGGTYGVNLSANSSKNIVQVNQLTAWSSAVSSDSGSGNSVTNNMPS